MNMNYFAKSETAMEPRRKQRRMKPGQQTLPSGLARDLEELRTCVLRRLESIEELARRCSAVSPGDVGLTEQMLKQRLDELELERSRACPDLFGDEPGNSEFLTKLENDRHLLAEAWERLERERIDAVMAGSAARKAQHAHHAHSAEGHATHTIPMPKTSVSVETANPVAESILRQFQTLCRDVRRTTDARCSPH
jgi:hypothetical protein